MSLNFNVYISLLNILCLIFQTAGSYASRNFPSHLKAVICQNFIQVHSSLNNKRKLQHYSKLEHQKDRVHSQLYFMKQIKTFCLPELIITKNCKSEK